MRSLLDSLRRRLSEPLPGLEAQLRMAPQPLMRPDPALEPGLRPAAALLLIYPHGDAWHVPLTVRGSGLRHHTGQVSLPGGRLDHPGESVEDAALREAHEEIGVVPADVEILGRLTAIPVIVSGHLLQPVIGVSARRPEFTLAAHEVERLIELPVVAAAAARCGRLGRARAHTAAARRDERAVLRRGRCARLGRHGDGARGVQRFARRRRTVGFGC